MSNEDELCDRLQVVYYDWVNPIVFSLAAILTLPWIYIYIKSYIKGDLKIKKSVFYAGILLFVTTFGAFITFLFWVLYKCHHTKISSIFLSIGSQLFSTQFLIVIGIFFYRLYYIFYGTSLALSKITLYITLFLYIISFTVSIVAPLMYTQFPNAIGLIVASLSMVFSICLTIYLAVLFIYKLYSIHKSAKNGTNSQIQIMTKTSILTFISIFATFIDSISFSLFLFITSQHFHFLSNVIMIADIYTNFLCVIFTYKCFDSYYIKACGRCHNKCQKCVVDKEVVLTKEMVTV